MCLLWNLLFCTVPLRFQIKAEKVHGYTLNLELLSRAGKPEREKKVPVNIISVLVLQSDTNKTFLILHDK